MKKLLTLTVLVIMFSLPFLHFVLDSSYWEYDTNVKNREEIVSNVEAYFHNEEQLVYFDSNVKSHFSDVKNVLYSSIVVVATALLLSLLIGHYLKSSEVLSAIKYAAIINLGLWAVLTGWILLDFSSFFTLFHKMLFSGNFSFPTNNLVIQVFPAQFWIEMSKKIIISEFILSAIILALPKLSRA